MKIKKMMLHFGSPTADRILTSPTTEIEYLTKDINICISKLLDTLSILNKNRIIPSLSANQIGYPYRIFIYESNGKNEIVINPFIVSYSNDLQNKIEDCLSCPGKLLKRNRAKNVTVRYIDFLSFEEKTEDLGDKKAMIFQHEVDHLNGLHFLKYYE